MNSINTLLMGLVAALFAALSFRLSRKLAEAEAQNGILWDQIQRHEAYIRDRVAEDEQRQRAAVMN